jgi:hypothetical protein
VHGKQEHVEISSMRPGTIDRSVEVIHKMQEEAETASTEDL